MAGIGEARNGGELITPRLSFSGRDDLALRLLAKAQMQWQLRHSRTGEKISLKQLDARGLQYF
jgi:hypothetical protein